VTPGSSTGEPRSFEELERIAEEQAALRRIATLVAQGAAEDELAAAVTSEIGHLFEADRANTMRLDGDTIRVIGAWRRAGDPSLASGLDFPYGGDTTTARIVATRAPARVDSAADLRTGLARRIWAERGLHASIGAPVIVDGTIWGTVTAFRTQLDDPFPPGAEMRLHDFAALVAQAIVNAEARQETAALVAEQTALRHIATLVAAARPQAEVLDAVTAEVGRLFGASTVTLLRPESDENGLVVLSSCGDPKAVPVEPGSRYHPAPGSATLAVLETGCASRSEETSPEQGRCSAIVAPVIINGSLHAVLAASRPGPETFPEGTETRLRSFADLAAQSIANARAQAEVRATRARIVRASDETRRRLERNLHDGAQQRLVSLSVLLRLATAKLPEAADEARGILLNAASELTLALEELRDLARGLHPPFLTERGLGPALEGLASRMPLPVSVAQGIEGRLPAPVEAAAYFVASEALTNVAKHAAAAEATVRTGWADGAAVIEVVDDGVGGADLAAGSGLQGLADRIEALGGSFGVDSAPGEGTRVWARIPLADDPGGRGPAEPVGD
jgi:signal transduction histidine kinase